MPDQSARFALPFIDPGQSQKEMTHNEALATLDAALQPSVQAVGTQTPPPSPTIGAQWIVGSAPTDAWVGQAQAIATWTTGGWRFVPPVEGMSAWSVADDLLARFTEGKWRIGEVVAARVLVGGVQVVGAQTAAVAPPTGGTVIDVEARSTLAAILASLATHGLIAAH